MTLSRLTGGSQAVRGIAGLIADIQKKTEDLDAVCLDFMGPESSLLLDAQSLQTFVAGTGATLAELAAGIRALAEACEELFEKAGQKALPNEAENALWDCKVQLSRLAGIADMCDRFRAADTGKNDIFWLETVKGRADREGGEGKSGSVRFVITPLDIGPLMREAVYEPIRTAVFTSATLTVAGSFSFWAGRIGLDRAGPREPIFQTFPSPFNYRENVLLGVPTDGPLPDSAGYKPFVARFVEEALRSSRGAGLVLFTSYALLRETFSEVQPRLADAGIRILKQGDDDRARLLDAFRAERSSVLFATDSFWEGVDAPGETLQTVILCRLPFRVPSEPVLRARMAAIEGRGGNPFAELSLPDAVVRLRQGFGRLMRRHDDMGVVLILDSRIVTKQYGAVFLESLPATARALGGSREVQKAVAAFFGQKKEREAASPSLFEP